MRDMRRLAAVATIAVLAASAAALAEAPTPGEEPDRDTRAVGGAINSFAVDLYGKLCTQEGNLFLSPYSISTALAMTYAGARGDTAAQMRRALHFNLAEERLHAGFKHLLDATRPGEEASYELMVANALWGQRDYGFLPTFVEIVRSNYAAPLNEVDFVLAAEAARKTINEWTEKETHGKIREIVPPGALGDLTRLVLSNAVYFKGRWASMFTTEATRRQPFTLANGEKVEVSMMNQTVETGYTEQEDFQALELSYDGDDLSMIVFLPKEADGLSRFEQGLTVAKLRRWLARLRRREVVVYLPRFTVTSTFSLGHVLKSMGISDAFDLALADFSRMAGGKEPLCVSEVFHAAFVDVNEEGTEAAAATALFLPGSPSGPVRKRIVFRADHPFLFLIRDTRSGSILFMGRVSNPKG